MSIHSLLVGIGKGMNAIESFHKLNYPVFYQPAFSRFLFTYDGLPVVDPLQFLKPFSVVILPHHECPR